MSMDHRQLTALLRRGGGGSPGPTPACPDETGIAAYFEGRVSAAERTRLESHFAGCRHCVGQIGVLARLGLEQEAPAPVPPGLLGAALAEPRRERSRIGPSRWVAAALAASLVAVLGSALWTRGQTPADAPGVRSSVTAPLALEVLQPEEDGVLPRPDAEIRWTEIAAALSYRVRVTTAEGDLLWQGEAKEPRLRVPRELALEEGRLYFVWVHAHLPDGKTLRSPAAGFYSGRRP